MFSCFFGFNDLVIIGNIRMKFWIAKSDSKELNQAIFFNVYEHVKS